MATRFRRATRTKPTISYAEPPSSDSDLDLDDDSAAEQSVRRRSSRRVSALKHTHTQPLPQTHPPKRQRPSRQTFDTDTSEDEISRPATKKTRPSKPISPKSSKSVKSTLVKSNAAHQTASSGVIPPWQGLPYQVLTDIFEYAVQPLFDEHSFQPSPSVKWLLQMARLCRAFAEPALTVLYSSPPLVPMVQAHRLVDLLKEDPTTKAFRYRNKIISLCIDVGQVVAYSLPGSGHLDVYDLIKYLPRLAELELYHQKDMSPYRTLDENIKWTYPEKLFDALEYIDPAADPLKGDKTGVCKLRSWRWSSRLAGKKWPLEKIREVHMMPSFANLRKIAFVNYQVPAAGQVEGEPTHENLLAESLKPLKHLDHLIFESSTLVNAKLLSLLPTTLRHLELINCWEVVADDFAAFLLTHGSQLRSLTLNHNQSLSLSFLPVLGTGCPKLQLFKMNLTYFNLHATYRDSEPQYDQLMLPDQIPIWPSTLQTIELIQLRKWQTEAAEMFFQSLLSSAATLPDLRRLTIQAILNIAWRDRASFREKWIGSLNRVFKRVSDPPKPHHSVRTREDSDAAASEQESVASPASNTYSRKVSLSTPQATPPRRTLRTCARNSRAGIYAQSPDTSDSEPDPPLLPTPTKKTHKTGLTRELEILKQTAGIDSPPDSPSSPAKADSSDDDEPLLLKKDRKGKAKETIQGMCEVVEVRIDNLRPTEIQVTEADFLDDEVSGDEDWNGDDDRADDGYAW
ncbi:uncharacterized protein BP5553_08347 [Venustampulla echinocandica]|uniref:Uncharacterized protein n=1 Tax=Venustampulla echinocandica TaxID=2656787 RepID=A0A370TGF6_9HELO|nr:uncharacterized protein BP5553_08347 [Venustampulla echinocandica]RDL33979.1 hypothetical protein BP5553_08347 [Venustampulla echinocandica]